MFDFAFELSEWFRYNLLLDYFGIGISSDAYSIIYFFILCLSLYLIFRCFVYFIDLGWRFIK